MAEEGLKKTANKLIHIGQPIPFDVDEFLVKLDELMIAAYSNKPDIRLLVEDIVSTYHPEDAGNKGSMEITAKKEKSLYGEYETE